MDTTDRPHFRTGSTSATATSELFVCFTSRISSSSSMKISKSILSPGRAARDGGPVSLSSSLSRRLRTNGSLKGGQASPFFSTTGRKRGSTFDNPEPSSPKVTCIGQVRVKTKKKVKQSRSLSKRRSGGGEVSFRKIEQQPCGDGDDKVCGQQRQECLSQRNQRWVHLPTSICEALREFSCLFPCRSSCSSASESERERSEKQSVNENGCGAVFARWLVSVNEGEEAKRREIELVVGGGDEEEEEERHSRRHVFEDIEVKDDRIELKGQSLEGGEEEAARVSICIPPKNALLLMRCRSDPMKMAALSNHRFSWDAFPQNQLIQEQHQEEEEGGIGEEEVGMVNVEEEVPEQEIVSEKEITDEVEEKWEIEGDKEETEEESLAIINDEEKTELEVLVLEEEKQGSEEEEVESNMSSFEALLDEDFCPVQDEEEEEEEEVEEEASVSPSTESDQEPLQESMDKAEATQKEEENNEETTDDEEEEAEEQEEEKPEAKAEAEKYQQKKEKEVPLLPECLLLMMREPKLSMEVSKETWVCSTDFVRWLPERPRKAAEPLKRRLSIDSKPKPEPPPMATMIEQKLVNAVAYEPFVLTRCKSEPMRTAAAKLIPESCFWKNAAAKGVGAAEVGF